MELKVTIEVWQKPTSWKTLIKVFTMFDYHYKRKEGSHHILSYPGAKRAVVISESLWVHSPQIAA